MIPLSEDIKGPNSYIVVDPKLNLVSRPMATGH